MDQCVCVLFYEITYPLWTLRFVVLVHVILWSSTFLSNCIIRAAQLHEAETLQSRDEGLSGLGAIRNPCTVTKFWKMIKEGGPVKVGYLLGQIHSLTIDKKWRKFSTCMCLYLLCVRCTDHIFIHPGVKPPADHRTPSWDHHESQPRCTLTPQTATANPETMMTLQNQTLIPRPHLKTRTQTTVCALPWP